MIRNSIRLFYIDIIVSIFAAIVLLFFFYQLANGVISNELANFDTIVTNWIQSFTSPFLTKVFIFITDIGAGKTELIIFLISLFLLLFLFKHFWEGFVLFLSIAGGWILNHELKELFRRSRPDLQHLVEVGGFSFPSGHAMVSVAFYGMLGYIICLNIKKWSVTYIVTILLFCLLIFFIGISRIYLGVHYPSDVLAGFMAGGIWLIGCCFALRTIRFYKGAKERL